MFWILLIIVYICNFYINASSLFKLWLAHILIYISYIKHNANLIIILLLFEKSMPI